MRRLDKQKEGKGLIAEEVVVVPSSSSLNDDDDEREESSEDKGLVGDDEETSPSVDERTPLPEESHTKFDREIERIGIGWFHYIAVSILGLGNLTTLIHQLIKTHTFQYIQVMQQMP